MKSARYILICSRRVRGFRCVLDLCSDRFFCTHALKIHFLFLNRERSMRGLILGRGRWVVIKVGIAGIVVEVVVAGDVVVEVVVSAGIDWLRLS